jgi:adenosylcobinamide kinase/adenosylcobinamide-phosphate guanylyltransferase
LADVTLILGGARSGKSSFAERLIEAFNLRPIYVATAEPGDAEMRARIEAHRARRGPAWRTVEEPLDLAATLEHEASPDTAVLVDCLTLWLTNIMLAERDVAEQVEALVQMLARLDGPVVLVSNEVGQGVVPANALARAFVDHAGRLHQDVATVAGTVWLVAAGLPLRLKPAS